MKTLQHFGRDIISLTEFYAFLFGMALIWITQKIVFTDKAGE